MLKMNFNFNYIRIVCSGGERQRVRSQVDVICITWGSGGVERGIVCCSKLTQKPLRFLQAGE